MVGIISSFETIPLTKINKKFAREKVADIIKLEVYCPAHYRPWVFFSSFYSVRKHRELFNKNFLRCRYQLSKKHIFILFEKIHFGEFLVIHTSTYINTYRYSLLNLFIYFSIFFQKLIASTSYLMITPTLWTVLYLLKIGIDVMKMRV